MVNECGNGDSYDTCHFLVKKIELTCNVTDKTYKVRGSLHCNSANVVYIISYDLCIH